MCDLYLIAGETPQNVWKNVELKEKYIFQTIAFAEASKCSTANTVILQSAVQKPGIRLYQQNRQQMDFFLSYLWRHC